MNRESKTSITMLPEDVMLDIFDFIRISQLGSPFRYAWGWERLAHVCRSWRQLVFASPLRLHIQLRCKRGTPVRTHLSCWPAFPIVIDFDEGLTRPIDEDVAIAALEHPNRVSHLILYTTSRHLAKLVTVIWEPFPALIKLQLSLRRVDQPVLLHEFLPVDGSPCLQELHLDGIYFQDVPALISNAHDLVTLHLARMMPYLCIPPRGMALCLSPLTKLRSFYIGFESDPLDSNTSLPNRQGPTPNTRVILPALTSIEFDRVCGYAEDLVAEIDCPRLNNICLRYHLDPSVNFQSSQIFKFIHRSEDPRLTLFSRVDVRLIPGDITLDFSHEGDNHIAIFFSHKKHIRGVSQVVQVFRQFSDKLCNVRHLSISSWDRDLRIGYTDWVQLLHSFTALQTLFVSGGNVEHISLALDEDTAGNLLPALNLLCLERGQANSCAKFCEDRRLAGRPVTVVRTQTEFKEIFKTYLRE
jgi:hypothetical protein